MNRYFIITVDTEGDNLWKPVIQSYGMRKITVKNADYIERFQFLCEKYHFIPTYLVDYEMANAEFFAGMAKERLEDGKCEIGMHMHAWNTPPIFELKYKRGCGNPYACEYSHEIMWEKLKLITDLLQKRFGVQPVSHRGGRWYIDPWYIRMLRKLGYRVDCSVTPGVSWKESIGYECGGNDYTEYPHKSYYMKGKYLYKEQSSGILEVPPTIIDYLFRDKINELFKKPSNYRAIMSQKIWLRPNGKNLQDMLKLVKYCEKKKYDYLEFMIHSSELMPGGSPIFRNECSIKKLYNHLEIIFERIGESYKGISLSDYAKERYRG